MCRARKETFLLRCNVNTKLWRALLVVWMGSCLALSGHAGTQDKQQAELEQLKRLLPPSAALDRLLDKYGYLPPDFDALPSLAYPVDFNEILAAAAPRRMLVVSPAFDWHVTPRDVLRAADMARRAYLLLGAGERLQVQSPERILEFDNDMQKQVIAWLNKP